LFQNVNTKKQAIVTKENTIIQSIKVRDFDLNDFDLIEKFKTFDRLYNIDWPIVHLETAQHYLDQKGESKEATGGSEWKKYLHPKYQQRRFFPEIWSAEEINNWG
jgi:tryptophan 2,3-dioxygenase